MELTAQQMECLKQKEIRLLRAFMEVCEKLNLKYYVLGGTLLGAVRHQGFIPWDDDIDLGMPREDYEKFLECAQAHLPENIFVQSFRTDPQLPCNFSKLRDSNTTFVEDSIRDVPINHGIYIDIFPLDYYPDRGRKLFSVKETLLKLRIADAFTLKSQKLKVKAARCVARVLYPTVAGAVAKRDKMHRSVTSGRYIANHCGAWGKKEIVPAEWYGEGTALTFEGLEVQAPSGYREWLTQVYGDYMQLPPEEKRIPHHYVAVFDPEKPYTEYFGGN